ncbi:NAD(P)-binding protein [Aaosphaeria arxii CBS 175.79]|uniref:NAD(P)-binding protein n=1 Tax=Aaosphaeria arxii CBS 175.79 TaxID=1450172 RepID=A0A6A5X9Q3_9PLEO|nr:NAD(P)-binding protein [Aaosphaeria arxii CBS 175.79]KAF2009474.1 NAD(P)-binding protein [Aaosphaeria arxii CBS 175.79]
MTAEIQTDNFKNIAIAGGTGYLGSKTLSALCASKKYTVTLLTHDRNHRPSSTPAAVIEVDYSSEESLIAALKNQDVLISVLGKTAMPLQGKLIDAALTVGVRRIIPSEFGSNLQNPKSRTYPTYASKVAVEEQLVRGCRDSRSTYTFIYTNCLFDWAISTRGALLLNSSLQMIPVYDGGDNTFSATTTETVGRIVVAVLEHFKETANQSIFAHDFTISSNEILKIAREVASDVEWTVSHVNTKEAETRARMAISTGVTWEVFYGFAVRAAFAPGYGGLFDGEDNKMLGIEVMSREQIKAMVKSILAEEDSSSRQRRIL